MASVAVGLWVGVGGRYEDFRDGRVAAGSMVPNRLWFQEMK